MKDGRLQLRVDAAAKRRLENAASEAHLTSLQWLWRPLAGDDDHIRDAANRRSPERRQRSNSMPRWQSSVWTPFNPECTTTIRP